MMQKKRHDLRTIIQTIEEARRYILKMTIDQTAAPLLGEALQKAASKLEKQYEELSDKDA